MSTAASVYEALVRARRLALVACDSCDDALYYTDGEVVLVASEPCSRDVAEIAGRALERARRSRVGAPLGPLRVALEVAASTALTAGAAALLNLNPLALLLLVAGGAAAVVSGALRRRGREPRASLQGRASLELVAHRLRWLVISFCSECRSSIPGYRCRFHRVGRAVVLELPA